MTPTATPVFVYVLYPPVVDVQFQLQFLSSVLVMVAVVVGLMMLGADDLRSEVYVMGSAVISVVVAALAGLYGLAVFVVFLFPYFIVRSLKKFVR